AGSWSGKDGVEWAGASEDRWAGGPVQSSGVYHLPSEANHHPGPCAVSLMPCLFRPHRMPARSIRGASAHERTMPTSRLAAIATAGQIGGGEDGQPGSWVDVGVGTGTEGLCVGPDDLRIGRIVW